MTGVRRQLRVAVSTGRALASNPFLLAYPIVATVLALGLAGALLAYPLAGALEIVPYSSRALGVAFLAYLVVVPVSLSFVMVAFTAEVAQTYRGQRPIPGEGIRVATDRIGAVVLAALLFGTGGYAVRYLGIVGRLGEFAGVVSSWGIRIAGTFVYPAIATTDGDTTVALERSLQALRAEWGSGVVTTVGTQTLGTLLTMAGLWSAVGLVAAQWLGWIALEVGPLGEFTLPVLLAVGGLAAAFVLGFAVNGLLTTALYLYATDGELPALLAADPADLVEVRGGDATPSDTGGPDGRRSTTE
ncbi:DUF6159 family protein [Natribaculum luteum]|uniref:DUF6159 family protein n=1 Tax=Natribaculum luteum TaxID=1586232 RepID=A0ABD5P3H2_9EURY|nr:DUF6159 family protein [Natribaculum luteum]